MTNGSQMLLRWVGITAVLGWMPFLSARSLVWTGAVDNAFDAATANWVVDGTSDATTFANGDDVTIKTSTDLTVEIKATNLKPQSVTLDVTGTACLTLKKGTSYLGNASTSWEKTGSGDVTFSGGVLTTIQGGFVINGGSVTFKEYAQLGNLSQSPYPFTVNEGAVLHLGCRNIFNPVGDTSVKCPIVVTRGTLKLSDSVDNGHVGLGPVTFEDAIFDVDDLPGWGGSYGRMTLTGKVSVKGTKPMTFAAFPVDSKGKDCVNLWFDPLTEFEVADVTGDAQIDCTNGYRMVNAYTNNDSKAWVPAGFVKSGAGTMILTNKLSDFTGDIEIRAGTLQVGFDDNANRNDGASSKWFMGNMTTTAREREFRVMTNGTLFLPNRNLFGVINSNSITNDQSQLNFTIVLDGGALRFANGQCNMLPRLTVRNGGHLADYDGMSGTGALQISDTFKVDGSESVVWPWVDGKEAGKFGILLNGYPETKFDVADVTQDSEADFDLGRPLLRWTKVATNQVAFHKTGAGTMRLSIPLFSASVKSSFFQGRALVDEGTLQVDGDFLCASGIVVRAGAYVSGTGSVANVILEENAGLRARIGQKTGLTVANVTTLAAGGTIRLDGLNGRHEREINLTVLTSAQGIAGVENLEGYAIMIDGSPAANTYAYIKGNSICVKGRRGIVVNFR